MTSTVFTPNVTPIAAEWLNDANKVAYSLANKTAATAITPVAGTKVFIESSDGGWFIAKTGAAPGTYADDGGSYCGTVFIPTGGDGSSAWVRDYSGVRFAQFYGASTSAPAATNTAASQAAIDAANAAGGGSVYLKNGTYLFGVGGSNAGRDYGLMLKSNVRLLGETMYGVILKSDGATDFDVLITDRSISNVNISIIDITIDGNQSVKAGLVASFNYWLYNVDGLTLDKVYSIDPTAFGFRVEQVTNLCGGFIRANHAADDNADGFHMTDCSYCAIDKIIIDTKGDDGFIIAADNDDTHDIAIGELIVTAPVTTAAAGKGIYLTNVQSNGPAGIQRALYNITIKNAITYNCKGSALVLQRGQFRNINVSLSDYGSVKAMDLLVGDTTGAGVTGYIRSSSFVLRSESPDESIVSMTVADGVIENNKLDIIGYDPGDGFVGVTLLGKYWTGNINIDYDPAGAKVSAVQVLDMFAADSNITVTLDGGTTGTNGIHIRTGATGNTFNVGKIQNTATNSIHLNSIANNTFIGGSIDNSVASIGIGTKFIGVTGANAYGSVSISPDANGNGTIAHGLQGTPNNVVVGLRGDNVNGVDVQTVDATNITVRIKDAAGADVIAGSFTVDWEAKL